LIILYIYGVSTLPYLYASAHLCTHTIYSIGRPHSALYYTSIFRCQLYSYPNTLKQAHIDAKPSEDSVERANCNISSSPVLMSARDIYGLSVQVFVTSNEETPPSFASAGSHEDSWAPGCSNSYLRASAPRGGIPRMDLIDPRSLVQLARIGTWLPRSYHFSILSSFSTGFQHRHPQKARLPITSCRYLDHSTSGPP
jgi:hypothetical protein